MVPAIRRLSCLACLILAGALLAGAQLLPDVTPEKRPLHKKIPTQIVVETSPKAQVYLDGALKGQAGAQGCLVIDNPSLGAHSLRVSLEGKQDFEQAITVVKGQSAQVKAPLAQGDPLLRMTLLEKVDYARRLLGAGKYGDAIAVYRTLEQDKVDPMLYHEDYERAQKIEQEREQKLRDEEVARQQQAQQDKELEAIRKDLEAYKLLAEKYRSAGDLEKAIQYQEMVCRVDKSADAAAKLEALRAQQNSVWTDPQTGLMWARQDNGSYMDWGQAGDYCRGLGLIGFSNWRLPTIDELAGIYDPAQEVNGFHTKGGIRIVAVRVWSSTRTAAALWFFEFYGGNRLPTPDFNASMRTLCVRRPGE